MGNDLTRRVAENNGTEQSGTHSNGSIEGEIRRMEQQFQLAMPKGTEATQLIRDALTALRATPKLAQCEQKSVLGALMTCAQLGLRPAVPGLGHAWVLPYWDKNLAWQDDTGKTRKGAHRAQLIIGYQGYRELAQRSGQISTLIGRMVHENDHFDIDYGVADNLVHKPCLDGPRGPVVGYYSIVKYANGGYAFWHMSRSEVEQHRNRYAKKNGEGEFNGPWKDNFDEMGVKTSFLKLAKWMPKSTELAAAMTADNSVRVDLSPDSDAMFHSSQPVIDGEYSEEPDEDHQSES